MLALFVKLTSAFVGFVLFLFHFVNFASFRFVFVDFVSFRFVSFSLISFRFVSFLFRFALYRYPVGRFNIKFTGSPSLFLMGHYVVMVSVLESFRPSL
jgi:hypothetical protein